VTDGCSGVFISVRRGRGIEGLGCGLGGWASLQKKNLFRSQNDVRVHFDAVFDWQKTPTVARSLGTRILRFNREMKFAKTVQKLSKNSQSDQRGAVAPSPKYAAVWMDTPPIPMLHIRVTDMQQK